jgi:hypothetical protein
VPGDRELEQVEQRHRIGSDLEQTVVVRGQPAAETAPSATPDQRYDLGSLPQ